MMTETKTPSLTPEFWEHKRLDEMSEAEWEALCDGCGRCCLVLLEDDDAPGSFVETSVSCRLFYANSRRCTQYEKRHSFVPGCVKVTPENVSTLEWMPNSCAYRRLAEGRGLEAWHPLISGRVETVAEAGIAVSDDVVNEQKVRSRHLWRYVTGPRGR